MAADTITLHLPDELFQRLERLAQLTRRPIESLIVQTLSSTFPSLPIELPAASRDALVALEQMSDDELWQQTRATLSAENYGEVDSLREKRRDGAITPDEEATLDRLLAAADLLTLRKGYAAVILRWRGHQLPTIADVGA